MTEEVSSFGEAASSFAIIIARDMRKLEPETRKAIRPKLRAVGNQLIQVASVNASWSSRIPAAMKVQVSFRQNREGVRVIVDQGKAPHARAYEGLLGRFDFFRHPVFGVGDRLGFWTKDTFVSQATRPFLSTAASAIAPYANQAINDALAEAAAATQSGGS